ncbi:MAG: amidohydrolase [Nitrospiraceae bacterium]|nr:amidohydrolase [Nitrospiraceae bacterium]
MESLNADKIKQQAEKYQEEWIRIRHHLHQHPELSFQEHYTRKYLSEQLNKLGIYEQQTVAGTGILARLAGHQINGKTLVLRADMDALPIEEENDIPYRSQNKGIMHACGHDVHMTCVLGAARILSELRKYWQGTLLLLFQPAEEKVPGGAKQVVESGLLTAFHPDLILGQHVDPVLQAGTVGYRPGKYMASSDELYLTVTGHGGHAALPDKVTNTPYVAARLLTETEETVEKMSPEAFPSVLRFGKVVAPGATNVIPNQVKMEGTFRTFDEAWRQEVHKRITHITENLAPQYGARANLEIRKGYPVLENDPETTHKAMGFSSLYLGKNNITNLDLRMTSEDFAYYSRIAPSLFFRLGITSSRQTSIHHLHTSHFDIYEPVLSTGVGHLAWLAYSFLRIK